jgi:glutamate racemase
MIGIFDSGSGGLSVFKEVRDRMPKADILYFGDIKNNPYGNRSPSEISELTIDGIETLLNGGANKIISACNSASANIVLPLFKERNIDPSGIIEMVGPTINFFRDKKQTRILLVATKATIESGIYQNGFYSQGINIQTLILPHLAGAIENGISNPAILGMISASLESKNGSYDTLILGCTHFPLVFEYFKRSVPVGVDIFNPAIAVALVAEKQFFESGEGTSKFLISKESDFFRNKVSEIVSNTDFEIEVI